jgi:transcriptional regulator with XRE-family HTH domain
LTSSSAAVILRAVETLYRAFGRVLREAREEAGLTQREVADRVGLTRTSITNIERGNQHIALHQLFLLAGAVGVEAPKLLPEDGIALEELVPPRALKDLDADPEEIEFAVRVLRKNERVKEAAASRDE